MIWISVFAALVGTYPVQSPPPAPMPSSGLDTNLATNFVHRLNNGDMREVGKLVDGNTRVVFARWQDRGHYRANVISDMHGMAGLLNLRKLEMKTFGTVPHLACVDKSIAIVCRPEGPGYDDATLLVSTRNGKIEQAIFRFFAGPKG